MDEKAYAITWLLVAVILKGMVPGWLTALFVICSILIVTVCRDHVEKEKGTSHRDAPNKTN